MLEILKQPHILGSLWLTARAVGLSFFLFLLVAPPVGYILARRSGPLVRLFGFIVTLPLIFPPIALGYLLLLALGRNGWLGAPLFDIGVPIIFTPTAVVIAGFIAGLPLVVRPLQAALGSRRLRDLEEAARVTGATAFQTFVYITVPLIKPALSAGLLMGCARVIGEVGITMMLGGNIAGRTNTLSLEIFNAVSRADFDEANVLCAVLVFIAVVLFFALETVLKRSVKL